MDQAILRDKFPVLRSGTIFTVVSKVVFCHTYVAGLFYPVSIVCRYGGLKGNTTRTP